MMKYRIMVLVLLCGLGVVQAQDGEPQYRLRTMSADDYLIIMQALANVQMHNNGGQEFANAVTLDWEAHFTHARPTPNNLIQTLNTLTKANEYWGGRDVFGKQIVQALIDEKILQFDPEKITNSHYDDFDIEATPRDFDGDGQPEWTLYVQSYAFTQRYVVAYDDQHYQLIDVPLPWVGCCGMYYSTQSGFTEEQLFADLTGDGLPEWVLAFGGIGANDSNFGELFVFQWQDGKLIDISSARNEGNDMSYTSPAGGGAPPLFPYGVSVTFGDINNDSVRDVTIKHIEWDNWDCSWQDQQSFVWQGKGFEVVDKPRIYDDVRGCEIRRAEEAVWSLDYDVAIQHYERALKLPVLSDEPQELSRYATARLAIAYKLAGHDEDARITINSLIPNEDDSPTLVKFIAAIKANLDDSMRLCKAAYEVFNFECPGNTDACLGSPLNVRVGETVENSGEFPDSPRHSFPAADQAGCDIAGPIILQLISNPFTTEQTPQSQLAKLGYKIVHEVHFDLNDDGLDEWLIWLDLPIKPLFFSFNKGDLSYHLTYAQVPFLITNSDYPFYSYTSNFYQNDKAPYTLKSLPDLSGKILITSQSRTTAAGYYLCLEPEAKNGISSRGADLIFAIWQFDDYQLKFQQEFPLCKNATLQDTFGDREDMPLEFSAWADQRDKTDYLASAIYAWDESQHRYVVKSVKPVPVFEVDYTVDYSHAIEDAEAALKGQDFTKASTIIEAGLTNTNIDKSIQTLMFYIRALTLEALNRPEEALAEYITIYKSDPESAWGKLAALHLECAANCKPS